MKQLKFLPRPFKALGLAAVIGLVINHANADRILYASFETPVVLEGATDPDGWEEGGGHPSYRRAANESGQNWSTPYGEQGMSTYSNGIGLKDLGYIPAESGKYVLKFNITSSASKAEYRAEILTQEEVLGSPLPEVIVAFAAGDTDGSKDMSFAGEIEGRYDPVPNPDYGEILPTKLLIKLMQDPNRSDWRNTPIWDNVSVDWIPDVDTAGPTVIDMADDKDGGTVAPNTLVTYTVTFSEDMNASTVDASDFGNGGSAPILSPVVEQVSPQVFLVKLTPTGEGSLYLKINEGAELKDAVAPVGNSMDTSSEIFDPVNFALITVDGTNPILLPSDIVDDKGGSSVMPNTPVTYTLTFSKDMNDTSVTSADFENAGDAPIFFGTIAETSPTSGVFTVQVTPTGPGTLRLQVKSGSLMLSQDGGQLDTSSEIADDTTLVVDGDPPILTDITDDTEGSPVTVGTLVTYDVFFSEDIDAATVDASDFGNAATVGNAPFTINSIEEASPGVFRIEVRPTGPGSIQLQVNAGALIKDQPGNALVTTSAIIDESTITVEGGNPYAAWADGAAFGADENGDGVASGMAWLLGADNPSANAIGRLPVASQSGGNLVLTFTCLKAAGRGAAVLKVEYSRDLGITDSWSHAEVPDISITVNGVNFVTSANADPSLIDVQATIPASAAAPGTTLFGRLGAVNPP